MPIQFTPILPRTLIITLHERFRANRWTENGITGHMFPIFFDEAGSIKLNIVDSIFFFGLVSLHFYFVLLAQHNTQTAKSRYIFENFYFSLQLHQNLTLG